MRETPPTPVITRFALGSQPMGFGSNPPWRKVSAEPLPGTDTPAPHAGRPSAAARESAVRSGAATAGFSAFARLPDEPSPA